MWLLDFELDFVLNGLAIIILHCSWGNSWILPPNNSKRYNPTTIIHELVLHTELFRDSSDNLNWWNSVSCGNGPYQYILSIYELTVQGYNLHFGFSRSFCCLYYFILGVHLIRNSFSHVQSNNKCFSRTR